MRHKVAGYKLGRTTSHRRSLFRNMATSLIMEERIETTAIKAKAIRPIVEKMITLGKKGDLAARRQAAAYLMTDEAVRKLFDTVAPRFGDRKGGYLRIVRTAWRKGDGAEKAFIELLGSEQVLDEKRQKRAETRAKKAEENSQGDGRSRRAAPGRSWSRSRSRASRRWREERVDAACRVSAVFRKDCVANERASDIQMPFLFCRVFFFFFFSM